MGSSIHGNLSRQLDTQLAKSMNTDLQQDTTSESEDEDGDSSENVCVVCLLPRLTTWILCLVGMPTAAQIAVSS